MTPTDPPKDPSAAPSARPDPRQLWKRYQDRLCSLPELGFRLDTSRMDAPDDHLERMAPAMARAFARMDELVAGGVANPDENRMVGHYWLRAPELAPNRQLTHEITSVIDRIKRFASDIHEGVIRPERAERFKNVLVIGIGGSALGPQLAADALGGATDRMRVFFLDNTDPDGMDRVLAAIDDELGRTLTLVISKSGGTPETRNGQIEVAAAYARQGLRFAKAAVAVTADGSALYKRAAAEGWVGILPMWDWVGGRTSELSAVGLLPAALQGLDIDSMLRGAREMDEITAVHDARANPAALLALMWHYATGGRGERDMVVLPYKDRLLLFARYLQQLVMESLGKEKDLDGNIVNQGIAVYGNKGSTDQHAYVQQLREGVNNFFVVFIEVLKDREGSSVEVDPGVTSGDYLGGLFLGTRRALYENRRESITITLPEVNAASLGMMIALFERAVGLYAFLVNINAYHQPGVEAGKKAAAAALELQRRAVEVLRDSPGKPMTADQVASEMELPDEAESVFFILERLAANHRGVWRNAAEPPWTSTYQMD